MLNQTITSDLLVDLSAEAQQLLAGGNRCKCGGTAPEQGVSPAQTEAPVAPVESYPSQLRIGVGYIITATPIAKCLESSTCSGYGSGAGMGMQQY